MLIDSHAHLDVPNYDADRAEVINRAREVGVEMMLEICGSDVAKGSLDVGLKLAEEYQFIYAAIGLHPHEASLYDEALEQKLLAMSEREKVIGWGEIGLDYHYDHSPRDTQRRVFRRQLELALERRLPAIIHTREAEDDTIQILRESWAKVGGVVPCSVFTPPPSCGDCDEPCGGHGSHASKRHRGRSRTSDSTAPSCRASCSEPLP